MTSRTVLLLTVLLGDGRARNVVDPRLSTIHVHDSMSLTIEQIYDGGEEGSVVWDASRTLLAFLRKTVREEKPDPVAGARVLEIGAGTGVVGLALARSGAKSVVLTDKHSQLPLMRKNIEHNDDSDELLAPVKVLPLVWGADWQAESDSSLSACDAFDLIVACDCVYPDRPSGLSAVLIDLLMRNPHATVLLAFEQVRMDSDWGSNPCAAPSCSLSVRVKSLPHPFAPRPWCPGPNQRPPPASAAHGVDHTRDFFEDMRRAVEVERVAESELDQAWSCDEISLWRMRARV
jgi:predicted nicotinamide N-methyase